MEKPVAKHEYKFIVPNSKTTISKLTQSEEFNFWKPDEILKQWWMANELSTLFFKIQLHLSFKQCFMRRICITFYCYKLFPENSLLIFCSVNFKLFVQVELYSFVCQPKLNHWASVLQPIIWWGYVIQTINISQEKKFFCNNPFHARWLYKL